MQYAKYAFGLLILLSSIVMLSSAPHARPSLVPSTFTGQSTVTNPPPGNDKTVTVTVDEPGVGALTVTSVKVNGVPATYSVTDNGSSSPTVSITPAPSPTDKVLIEGDTAGGDGSDYPANLRW